MSDTIFQKIIDRELSADIIYEDEQSWSLEISIQWLRLTY
jgi:diadenosine tetraphosphate (Ap4A) HIT family hydrolase